MTEKFRLIPSLDTGVMGSGHYLFDRLAETQNIVYVPTQKISPGMAQVIQTIKHSLVSGNACSMEEIRSLFSSANDLKRVSLLVSSGYLEQVVHSPQGTVDADDSVDLQQAFVAHFQSSVVKHYLKNRSFFNLPHQIDNSEVNVGLIGVPVSSIPASSGTVFGPDRLRQHSQNAGFWFDFYKSGIYTEVGCDNTTPELICRDIVAKDFGDIGAQSRTVGELFGEVAEFIRTQIIPDNIRPIFYGGDHAITFPIVNAFLHHHPTMVLLHLDAHNDVFYTENVEFSHASPILGLLMQSNLSAVHSFGLRTNADPRVAPFRRFSELMLDGRPATDRIRMHSLNATRRRLQDLDLFKQYLVDSIGEQTPCYLTIDLDVLSANALNNQLSTPAGTGLEFQELFEFIGVASQGLNIIGADIVEFSVNGDTSSGLSQRELTILSMHLVEGLYQSSLRNPPATDTGALVNAPLSQPISTDAALSGSAEQETRARGPAFTAINSVLPSSGFRMKELERRSVKELKFDDFLSDFVLPGIPLVLTGCAEGQAIEKWSFEYFLEHVPLHDVINVNVYTEPFQHSKVEQRSAKLRDILSQMKQRQGRTLESGEERYNIVDWAFGFTSPELFADIPEIPFFDLGINEHLGFHQHALKWIYFGEPGTGSRTHVDVLASSAWLLLAKGRKAWRMVHSNQASRCLAGNEWVDLFAPDTRKYPETVDLAVWETIQKPGEVIWTPSQCVHAVRNLEYSIAVTQNYIDLTNLSMVHNACRRGSPYGAKPERQVPALATLLKLAMEKLAARDQQALIPMLLPAIKEYALQNQDETSKFQSDLQLVLSEIG